jgi:hypothetical protein
MEYDEPKLAEFEAEVEKLKTHHRTRLRALRDRLQKTPQYVELAGMRTEIELAGQEEQAAEQARQEAEQAADQACGDAEEAASPRRAASRSRRAGKLREAFDKAREAACAKAEVARRMRLVVGPYSKAAEARYLALAVPHEMEARRIWIAESEAREEVFRADLERVLMEALAKIEAERQLRAYLDSWCPGYPLPDSSTEAAA